MRDNLSSCTSSTLWSCLSWVYSVYVLLLCCFSSMAHSVMFSWPLCFSLSLFVGSCSFVSPFETRWCYIKDPQSFTSRARWFHINNAVHSRLEHGCGLLRNTHAFSKFSQCEYCYLKLPKRCKQLENLSAQIWTYFPCFGCKSRTTFWKCSSVLLPFPISPDCYTQSLDSYWAN